VRSLADEVPFDIPDSWEWVRVRNCTELFNGRAFKPSDWAVMGLPIVRIQNLNDEKAPFNYYDKSVEEDVHLYGVELLFAWSGTPGTSFGAHIWRNQEAVLNQHIFKLLFDETALFKPYYMYALNQRVGSLIKAAHGSAGLQHVTRGVFESTLIPLPPFAEQIRIVEKLNVLFPIVDHYSSAYNNLNNLQSAFPEALKKSILQEGVQGKLVPQDPSDEPAEALLERIRAEKQRLIKEGKIKKDKHESVIFRRDNSHYEKRGSEEVCIDEEIPFEIPENWAWCRASSLGTMIRGRGIKRTETVAQGCPCIRYGEIYTTYETSFDSAVSFVPETLDKDCLHFSSGDVVFTLTGENKVDIAKTVAFLGKGQIAAGGDLAFWTHHGMNPLYLVYYMASPYCIELKRRTATGDIIVHISTSKVGDFLVPIPPIKEQNRIVSAIEQLFAVASTL
jgi:type I restriction enzyme S subunit